jgi:hypothetical protein
MRVGESDFSVEYAVFGFLKQSYMYMCVSIDFIVKWFTKKRLVEGFFFSKHCTSGGKGKVKHHAMNSYWGVEI